MASKISDTSTARSGWPVTRVSATVDLVEGVGLSRPPGRAAQPGVERVAQGAHQVGALAALVHGPGAGQDAGEDLLHQVFGVLARSAQRPRGSVEHVQVLTEGRGIQGRHWLGVGSVHQQGLILRATRRQVANDASGKESGTRPSLWLSGGNSARLDDGRRRFSPIPEQEVYATMSRNRIRTGAAALAAAVLASAAVTGVAVGAASANPSAIAAGAKPATVNLGSTSIGKILVTKNGFTLYAFLGRQAQQGQLRQAQRMHRVWPLFTTQGKPKAGKGSTARCWGRSRSREDPGHLWRPSAVRATRRHVSRIDLLRRRLSVRRHLEGGQRLGQADWLSRARPAEWKWVRWPAPPTFERTRAWW